ncbi:AraC family transcriptional regulator [Cupriavidus oxalaticus]|uniref:AraC family transcriptional regulator n=2 Tax=Cupriavidus oxalaticus TaxID=96344 RepID=A0A5P3VAT8_9BURK|nr:AraC family transcriptional regulator [Cupriavidus oxalaticus]
MRVHLQSPMHISLQRLLLAFPLSVAATQGRVAIRRRGYERVLLPGQEIAVAPFEAVDLHLDGSGAQPALCDLELHGVMPAAAQAALHHRICKRVFLQPQYAWSAAFIAERLDMSTAQVRRTLFAQGTALTDLCRTQRLMRVLFEAMSGQVATAGLARFAGWPANSDLDCAFYDRFGLSIDAARRLALHRAPERHRSVA